MLKKMNKGNTLYQLEEKADKEKSPSKISLLLGIEESSYLALMNFLILIPFIGWFAPIIFWISDKNVSTKIKKQGKYIFNWYISLFLYYVILSTSIYFITMTSLSELMEYSATIKTNSINLYPLFFKFFFEDVKLTIGGILIIIEIVICILIFLFPIIGGIKGLSRQTWKYPLSIPFLR